MSDEHVVPFSLGGKHVIQQASCLNCQKITGRIEQAVARGMWGDARIAFNAPTRRPKERPKYFSIPTTRPGQTPITVQYSDYPAGMVFYWTNRAGILQGLPQDVDLSAFWLLKAITDIKKADEFHKKHPNRLVMQFRHEPENFARMLIKIGYCQVLTQLDRSDFDEFCTPYIIHGKANPSFIFGGNPNAVPSMAFGYYLNTAGYGTLDDVIIVAEIKLFSNLDTPFYHVVVGRASGRQRVEYVLGKLGAIIFPLGANYSENINSGSCGKPLVWPISYWPSN